MPVGKIESFEIRKVSVIDLVDDIEREVIKIPAFQRKLVWGEKRIVKLFDSIMRGYPIGTFLFWELDGVTSKRCGLPLLHFIKDFSEFDSEHEVARRMRPSETCYAVLDGQQRLASLYIGIHGSLALHEKYKSWDNPNSYPKKELYVNACHDWDSGEDSELQGFKFFKSQPSNNDGEYWVNVPEMFSCESWLSFKTGDSRKKNLKPLWDAVHNKDKKYPLSYCNIHDSDIEDVIDIFVRINSGGMQLSRSDLLFSTLSASWSDARGKVDKLIKGIKSEGFTFGGDFILRSALACTDNNIAMKVDTFNQKVAETIKSNWDSISDAILETCKLLGEFGYTRDSLVSENAVIPLVYHCFKCGKPKRTSEFERWNELRKYLAVAQINRVFSASVDSRLSRVIGSKGRGVRYGFSKFGKDISLEKIAKISIADQYPFRVTEEDLDRILGLEKDDRYTFAILSLLYADIRTDLKVLHKDHLHPKASFEKANLSKLGINLSEEEIQEWREKRDKLPNLQLLPSSDNESKGETPLEEWVKNPGNEKLLEFMDGIDSYSLKDFDAFYEKRRANIQKALRDIFGMPEPTQP